MGRLDYQECHFRGGVDMNCCENCIYALYDSVPYGSTNANYLSGCKKEDEITEQEYEGAVKCSRYEPCVYEEDVE